MLKDLEDIVFDKEIKAGAARRSSLIAVPVPDATEHGRLVLSAKDTKQREWRLHMTANICI